MHGRFRHATHIVRVATVFFAVFLAFLIARWALIPADFGTLGFYRAGAIDDASAWPIAFSGRATCETCHVGKYWSDFDDAEAASAANPTKDNRHFALGCESCHGPLAFHSADQKLKEEDKKGSGRPVPLVADDKLCLGCHRRITGRPEHQPQVISGDHGDNDKCDSCHRPHRPRTDEDED